MSVFALLIKYLFIVFILVAFFVIGVVAYFLHRVRNAARRFANGGMGGGRSSAANNGTYGSGDIYDSRSPREANRKIFAKDEGEYVDFVEE